MDTQLMENPEEPLADTPEDVAILYSWANLHGAKYRDFSASRREYRAQVRHRAAEDLRLTELQAKSEAEAAAAEAERVAREAERAARQADSFDSGIDRERVLQEAENAARRAAAERVEAARRAEAAAIADAVARREEREIAEAHASAQRQAARWADSEIRRRSLAGPQPQRPVPGPAGDPYESYEHLSSEEIYNQQRAQHLEEPVYRDARDAGRERPQDRDRDRDRAEEEEYQRRRDRERLSYSGERRAYSAPRSAYSSGVRQAYSGERRIYRPELEVRRRPQGFRPDDVSGVRPAYRAPGTPVEPVRARIQPNDPPVRPAPAYQAPPQAARQREVTRREEAPVVEQSGPAWLYSSNVSQPAAAPQAPAYAPVQPQSQVQGGAGVEDTLQHSRERVASRWFALKGVFEPGQEPAPEQAQPRQKETRTPVLTVFSLAGGVGKTSLVATLGRTLSSVGEKVLLADTTSHGLLPYYFGATELRPGVVRTFSPPSGSTDAPIYLVSFDTDQRAGDRAAQDSLGEEITRSASGTNRIVLDLNASSSWVIRKIARMNPTILVPVSPDMNSVISLQGVEKFFAGAVDNDGRPILPHYVLNQFDASLPLHLDVREVLRRQLGDRLLPFVIRRAPAVSEALAEGMTVVDYAPEAGVAEDYMNIANWVRSVSAPATQGFRNVRWSER